MELEHTERFVKVGSPLYTYVNSYALIDPRSYVINSACYRKKSEVLLLMAFNLYMPFRFY
jgi:hypothetical protein